MRPRIVGSTARLIHGLRADDEEVSETTDRLLSNPLDKAEMMGTMEDWEFPDEFEPVEQIRPRISESSAERIESAHRSKETYSETVDRLLVSGGEWDGIDVDGFRRGHGEPYVDSVQTFAEWYDHDRPPTAYDVEAWLADLSEDYQHSTLRRHYHALKAYFKYEIGDWDEPARKPSRDELIDALQDLAEEMGETPNSRDIHSDPDKPGIHHYQNEFDTWNAALEAAGLSPNEEKVGQFTDEQLLEDLREFATEMGDVPTSTQMMESGPHSTSTYITRFGSWSKALKEAGLSIEDRYGGQTASAGVD